MSSAEAVPGGQYVLYRMFDTNDHLLYVGRTMNVERRVNSHRRSKTWWQDIVTIKLEHFPDHESLVAAEAVAVAAERPRHNLMLIKGERRTRSVRRAERQEVGDMPVRWVEASPDDRWTPEAAELRTRPGEWGIVDVPSANPSSDKNRINHGVLSAFRPRGHFQARVVEGEIWAVYSPPGTVTGDDPP